MPIAYIYTHMYIPDIYAIYYAMYMQYVYIIYRRVVSVAKQRLCVRQYNAIGKQGGVALARQLNSIPCAGWRCADFERRRPEIRTFQKYSHWNQLVYYTGKYEDPSVSLALSVSNYLCVITFLNYTFTLSLPLWNNLLFYCAIICSCHSLVPEMADHLGSFIFTEFERFWPHVLQ